MTDEREFTIVREFDAPRELVFRCWTDPDHLAQWFGPRNFSTPRSSIDVDARPGGAYTATMVDSASGKGYPSTGVFREVVEPERLVFTWGGTEAGESTTVMTVTFDESEGKTAMTFHLRAVDPIDPTDEIEEGWGEAIDKLNEHLRAQ